MKQIKVWVAVAAVLAGLIVRITIILAKPEVLWIDDSFYSLGIARSIASGNGWTHDGTIITNGFQPLYVFLMVPFYLVLPSATFAVPIVALVLQSIINLISGILLFLLINSIVNERISMGGAIALLAWNLSPYVISGVNGLETSLQAFLIIMITYFYSVKWRTHLIDSTISILNRIRIGVIVGVFLGLLILTRIDSSIFVLALMGDFAVLGLRRSKGHCGNHFALKHLGIGIAIFASIFVIVLPWLIANYLQTGGLGFDSGPANRLRAIVEYDGANIYLDHLKALIPNLQLRTLTPFMPWSAMVRRRYLYASMLIAVIIGLLALKKSPIRWKISTGITNLGFLWVYGISLLAVYVFYQFTVWNWPRYFYSLALLGIILLGLWVELILSVLSRRSVYVTFVMMCLGLTILLPFSIPKASNPLFANPVNWFTSAQYEAAQWLKENTPADVRLASFQSGIIGYYSERQTLNLDGVVNPEALPYYLNGDTAMYLLRKQVDYLVDWHVFTSKVDFHEAGLDAKVIKVFEHGNPVEVIRLMGMQ